MQLELICLVIVANVWLLNVDDSYLLNLEC